MVAGVSSRSNRNNTADILENNGIMDTAVQQHWNEVTFEFVIKK